MLKVNFSSMWFCLYLLLTHILFTSTKISDFQANVDILDEINPGQSFGCSTFCCKFIMDCGTQSDTFSSRSWLGLSLGGLHYNTGCRQLFLMQTKMLWWTHCKLPAQQRLADSNLVSTVEDLPNEKARHFPPWRKAKCSWKESEY